MSKWRVSLLIFMGILIIAGLAVRHSSRLAAINTTTKTCLVTGASSGIGKHLAIEMVKRGWTVVGIARRAELLNQLSQKLGPTKFVPFVCDVSNREQVHAVSEKIKSQGLKPTLFFLNAGIGALEQKWQVSSTHHQQTFATNYLGNIALIEEWLLSTKQLGSGTFVAISSVTAFLALPASGAYAASKIALVHCFDALRRQYLHDNIGFSVVLPGPVDTDMFQGQIPFKHQADDEARYIIDQVFGGKKQIEPSWFYSVALRLANLLPDAVIAKFLGS